MTEDVGSTMVWAIKGLRSGEWSGTVVVEGYMYLVCDGGIDCAWRGRKDDLWTHRRSLDWQHLSCSLDHSLSGTRIGTFTQQ